MTMDLETRVREYFADKAGTIDVADSVAISEVTSTHRRPLRAFALAAAAVLLAIGLPLGILASMANDPIVDEPPGPLPAVDLEWTAAMLPTDRLGGQVIEVDDGWLFVPSQSGDPAFWSSDGRSWTEINVALLGDLNAGSFREIVKVDDGFAMWGLASTGFTTPSVLTVSHSQDGRDWEPLDFLDPLPTSSDELFRYTRSARLVATREIVVLADLVQPSIEPGVLRQRLGLPDDVGISMEVGGGIGAAIVRDEDGVVSKTTYDELGLDPAIAAQLSGREPVPVTMWASSDGGRSWQRGDTIDVHGVTHPLTMGASANGFVATDYMRGLVWFSSDGLRWEAADGTEGIDIVKGGSDRFLGRTMEPNRLWISSDGVAWFPAAEPASLSLWGGPFGFVRVQEGIDGEPVYAFSSDSYTWLETNIQPPDDRSDGIRISVSIGDRSVAIVQADADDVITVHIGVADE